MRSAPSKSAPVKSESLISVNDRSEFLNDVFVKSESLICVNDKSEFLNDVFVKSELMINELSNLLFCN